MLFRSCIQKPGQSDQVYLTELRDKAQRCNFGTLLEDMICERFIEGCASPALRNKLCMEDKLTMKRLLEVSSTLQASLQRQQLVGGATGGQAAASAARDSLRLPAAEVAFTQRKPKEVGQRHRDSTCFACGKLGHWANDSRCPARGKKCHKCHKEGHVMKCCRSKGSSTAVRPRNREVRAVQILSVEQQPAETGPWYQLEVDGVLMKMLVDTGEAVSIIPKAAYRQNFSRFELKRPKVRLEAYGGGQINVFGMITVPVTSQDGQRVWSDFYVAEARVPLLGRDMQQVFGITVRNGVSVSSVEVMAQCRRCKASSTRSG